MSRTPLENAPKNRSILKIKDRFSLSLSVGRRRRDGVPTERTENQWEKKREKHRQRERKRERECATCVAAGVRLIVVSNRLYPGILIHSQLSALVAARDEQNVVRVYIAKSRIQTASVSETSRRYLGARPPYVDRVPIYQRVCYLLYLYLGTYIWNPASTTPAPALASTPIRRSGRTSLAVVKVSTYTSLTSSSSF